MTAAIGFDDWPAAVHESAFEGTVAGFVAIRLVYGGTGYGVLTVYAADSDDVVELALVVDGVETVSGDLADALDCRLATRRWFRPRWGHGDPRVSAGTDPRAVPDDLCEGYPSTDLRARRERERTERTHQEPVAETEGCPIDRQ